MRKAINISASLLLCLWYIMAIAGLDIHSDRHDSRTYVVSLLEGISCEVIHPEDECVCCHSHETEEGISTFDCTNDIHLLSLAGFEHHGFSSIQLFQIEGTEYSSVIPEPLCCAHFIERSVFHSPPRSELNKLCVLRV